jgi:hypothetical protein
VRLKTYKVYAFKNLETGDLLTCRSGKWCWTATNAAKNAWNNNFILHWPHPEYKINKASFNDDPRGHELIVLGEFTWNPNDQS